MNPQEFVSQLLKFTRSKDYYLNEGFDEPTADLHSRYNVLTKLANPKSVMIDEPFLKELFSNYDLSNFEVSFTKFTDIPYDLGDSIHFADEGPNYLMIDKSNGEVFMENSQSVGETLKTCASDIQSFLKVLLIVEEYNSKNGAYEPGIHNIEKARKVCQSCIDTAGGNKYFDYCVGLFSPDLYDSKSTVLT